MRLAYFYDRPFPAPLAAPIQILNTCRVAADLGAEVNVYVRRLKAASEEECLSYYGLTPHERLRIVPLAGPWGDTWSTRRLRPALRGICAVDGPSAIVSRGTAATRIALELGELRGPRTWRFALELHHLSGSADEQTAVAAADAFICVNRSLGQAAEDAFGAARPILVLPSGTRIPPEPLPRRSPDHDVLFAGKLGEGQGVKIAIAAMRFLPGRRLLVLGGTPAEVRAAAKQARRLGLADRVVFTGFVPPAQVPTYLERTRVGVCPYATDVELSEFMRPGGSLKLLELLANGVPAVASDLGWIRDLATHDRDAWLVEPDSPEALAEGVRTLLDHPELAARLVAAGRERARDFSWERRASRLLGFLASLEPLAV